MLNRTFAAVFVVVALAGCSGDDSAASNDAGAADSTPSGSPTSQPPETGGPERNERGNVVRTVGEPAQIFNRDRSEVLAEFTVDAIELNARCESEYAEPSENGQLIKITITATVRPGFEALLGQPLALNFIPSPWKIIGPDGVLENGINTDPTFTCLTPDEQLPNFIGDGETGTGKIVLDTGHEHATLIFDPGYGGWEWEF